MALLRHTTHRPEFAESAWDWDEWPELFRRPWMSRWAGEHFMRVEEFSEDDTLVVRAELAGIDPDKDVEISVSDHLLTIEAQRREEEKVEKRNYVRNELRYGSFSRAVSIPKGVTEADIKATYKDGILEVRIPCAPKKPAVKVPISKGDVPTTVAS